jgi:hypothetical protein
MNISEYRSIRICVDCLFDHANGECGNETEHGCADQKGWPDWSGYYLTLGATTDECGHNLDVDDEAHAEDCEQHGFSWASCQWCGSTLGGDRFAATAWPA